MSESLRAADARSDLPFRLLNKHEVAVILGCTVRTVDRMIASRSIPFLRIPTGTGRKTRRLFDSRDIESWLEQYRHAAIRKEGRQAAPWQ